MGDDKPAERREKKRKRDAAHYASHRKEILEQKRVYTAAHREEKRVYDTAYYAEHREEKLEAQRAYVKEHPEEIREQRRAYYESHREEISAYLAAYREEHREELREKKRAYDEAHREERRKQQLWFSRWLTLLKATQGCTDCGTHEGKLHYHHIDPTTKRYTIADMAHCSEETFLDEVAKCTVLCPSCHRKRHKLLREESRDLGEGQVACYT